MNVLSDIQTLAGQPMTKEEIDAQVTAVFLAHRNTNPFFRHIHSRLNAQKAKDILGSLPSGGERLKDFVKQAGVILKDFKIVQFTQIIRKQKPRVIYEFGAGGTTALFAELLRENERKYGVKGELHAFEQSRDYYDALQKAFPEELRKYLTLHLCDTEYKKANGYRTLSYKKPELGHDIIDLTYVDGPDHIYDGIQYKEFPFYNGDIVDLVQQKKKISCAVCDGRWFNWSMYKQLLPGYRNKQYPAFKSFTITPV